MEQVSSSSGTNQAVVLMALPKTIEEATRRYLHHYSRNFVGPASESSRLKSITRAFIHKLRKVAPKFYEEKLPQFINQACSTLLTYDTSPSNSKGVNDFHKCHSAFLSILRSFKHSQPKGEINFQDERARFHEKTKLLDDYLKLKARIEKLEATEFDYDEIGEDEEENAYESLFNELDKLKAELKRVSIEIAYMDGFEVEQAPAFELRIPPRSILNYLTKEQLSNLEKQMFDLVKANNNQRTAMYVDKSIIDSMIEKLDIDLSKFKKEQIKDITKDALDAYKSYFREIDLKNREVFHNELLTRPSLVPKEGLVIANPDDVPEDVKVKLERNNWQCKREIDDLLDTYSKRPCAEDHTGDVIDDVEPEDETLKIIETVRAKAIKYERIKEEPRDDCEDYSSDDEQIIDAELAKAVVDNKDIVYVVPSDDPDTSGDEENQDVIEESASKPTKFNMSGGSDGISNSHDESGQDDVDDEIEFLGTVEPTDKIKTLELEE